MNQLGTVGCSANCDNFQTRKTIQQTNIDYEYLKTTLRKFWQQQHAQSRSKRQTVRAFSIASIRDTDDVEKVLNPDPVLPPPTYGAHRTLTRSFTVSGYGLHTGQFAVVKILPAKTGSGRFFVKMEPGTNEGDVASSRAHTLSTLQIKDKVDDVYWPDTTQSGPPATPEELQAETAQLQDYLQYLRAQEDGKTDGKSFGQFRSALLSQHQAVAVEEAPETSMRSRKEAAKSGPVIDASIENVRVGSAQGDALGVDADVLMAREACTLSSDGNRVHGVEHVLAALEACGIVDAEIQIEGGDEIPLLDGCASTWCSYITAACHVPGSRLYDGDQPPAARKLLKISKPLMKQYDQGFIQFIPGGLPRLSCGVDLSHTCPAVGAQWASLSLAAPPSRHFATTIAPARTWCTLPRMYKLQRAGLARGPTRGAVLLADYDTWLNSSLLSWDNEPARHKVIDMLGVLALCNFGGAVALPAGHVQAFNVDMAACADFGRELTDAASQPVDCLDYVTDMCGVEVESGLDDVAEFRSEMTQWWQASLVGVEKKRLSDRLRAAGRLGRQR